VLTGYFGDADIAFLLGNDFGVAVVVNGVTIPGIKDEVGKDQLLSQGISGVSGTDISVTVQTSALRAAQPNLPNRTAITVDGVAMRLRDQNPLGDGALTHLLCELIK
jgi:hypothetical protein